MKASTQRAALPFLPEDRATRSGGSRLRGRHISRVVTAAYVAKIKGVSIEAAARQVFPDDEATAYLIRAAVSPATTSATGWAAEIASTAVGDFVASLAPESAAARLMGMGTLATLDGRNSVLFPRRVGLPATVPFIAEGGALPVVQRDLTAVQLGPAKKLAVISGFSEDLAQRSAMREIVEVILREDAAASLDVAIFSDAAASASRPAGILNGIAPITPTAGGGFEALLKDIELLVAAIVAAGGGSRIVMLVSPTKLATLAMLTGPGFPYDIIATRALAADTIIALDPGAFASGFGPTPDVNTSGEAILHFDDTTPLAIGTAGTPNSVAAPVRSLWQSALVGVRLILDCAWVMRGPQIAWISGATW